MKINLDWLTDYVDIEEGAQALADALTMAGLEVEGIEEVAGETVLEIGVTPNRPDWLCHLGVAREVAAIFSRTLRLPKADLLEEGTDVQAYTSIDIEDPEGCPRYSGRVMTGVSHGIAPEKVTRRLESIGIRSISNVVDATNYVMMELGQPLHAFDYHRLAENRIVVRKARKGEILETLDGQKRQLTTEDLLICDGRGPVALAGIMGGLNSEVLESTQDLLLESACFDPMTIRRSSKRLGLSTEASYRFERGTDPTGTARAVDRLAYLIREWAGGDVCKGVWDAHPRPEKERCVPFRMSRVKTFLGVDIPGKETVSVLRRLQLAPEKKKGELWEIKAPGFRRDLSLEEDVIEEIARIYGYDQVPVTLPVGRTVPVKTEPIERLQENLRDALEGIGFNEAVTFSFISQSDIEDLGIGGGVAPVSLMNPISEEMTVMRTSILPGLLKALRTNISRRTEDVRLYETGRVFLPCGGCELPEERLRVAGVMTGVRSQKKWFRALEEADFFDVKGAVEAMLGAVGITTVTFKEMDIPHLQPGQSAWVMAGEVSLGSVGTLHPSLKEKYRAREWAGVFELDLHHMLDVDTTKKYARIPQYPEVLRDLAVIVGREVPAEMMEDVIRGKGRDLGRVNLFDLYEGKGVPEGSRSLAWSLRFQSPERTLTDEEVDASMAAIVKALEKGFGAKLR
ncbi:MAG: phenylalanine--tRNA ligase subunit beta [bacterium]|nr:MAG: phenylalanine--tRNA ligase subunit beta [bacterium]